MTLGDHIWHVSSHRGEAKVTRSLLSVAPLRNSHAIYGITQCYLPPGRGDIPALTIAEAGTQLGDRGEMQG